MTRAKGKAWAQLPKHARIFVCSEIRRAYEGYLDTDKKISVTTGKRYRGWSRGFKEAIKLLKSAARKPKRKRGRR